MKIDMLKTGLLVLVLLLTGCSVTLKDYHNTQPAFEMAEFFNGQLKAYGMVQDRSGKVIRRFSVDMIGRWDRDQGVLEEDFVYGDGEVQRRIWYLNKLPDGSYQGTASDVSGEAVGYSEGFAFNWRYTLVIEVDGKYWDIQLNDWIYQLDGRRLINRTVMRKWGIKVGELTLLIEKTDS